MTTQPGEPVANALPRDTHVEAEEVHHRLSEMTLRAENPEGMSLAAWAQMFPPNLVRPLLRVAAAAMVYLEPVEGFEDAEVEALTGNRLETFERLLNEQWQEMSDAMEEWQRELVTPVGQYLAVDPA
jgi:hypothetical protein